jgi:hypothetical protein
VVSPGLPASSGKEKSARLSLAEVKKNVTGVKALPHWCAAPEARIYRFAHVIAQKIAVASALRSRESKAGEALSAVDRFDLFDLSFDSAPLPAS